MNRARAKAVNKKSDKLSKKSNLKYNFANEDVDEFINIVNDIETNITLSNKSIFTLLEYLFKTYQIEPTQCYEIIENELQLEKCLTEHEELKETINYPYFIVCRHGSGPISTICIETEAQTSGNSIYNVCNISVNNAGIPQDMKNVFQKIYNNISYFEKSVSDLGHDSVSDIVVISCLETILKRMMECKSSFLIAVQKYEVTAIDEVKYRKLLGQLLQEIYINQSFESVLSKDIQENAGFKEALKKFINETCEAAEDISYCTEYNSIRNEEIERCSRDPNYKFDTERVNKAKQAFLNCKSVKTLNEKYAEKMKDPNFNPSENQKVFQPDVEQRFSTQMTVIRRILTLVEKCKVKSVREIAERTLSKHLGIDYEKIRKFTSLTSDTENKNENNFEEDLSPISINDILLRTNVNTPLIEHEIDVNIKTSEQILAEISFPGVNSVELLKNKTGTLEVKLKEIIEISNKWSSKGIPEINEWSKYNRGSITGNKIVEAISVLNRANEICTGGHKLRIPQIVTLLTFFSDEMKNENKICQVQTGEGKTTIIALLAALQILAGKKFVDVITSNSVLAAEGMKSSELFFSLLNITVAENNPTSNYDNKRRACYRADITYGTIGNFQFDYLRHEFEGMETRGDRTFDFLILDEVDCMLIDNASHIAKLSTPFAGMEYLKYVYIQIWVELREAEDQVASKLQKFRNEMIENLKNDVRNGLKTADAANKELNDLVASKINNTHDEIIQYIKNAEPHKIPMIPNHLEEYCSRSLSVWIENAIYAKYSCLENVNYIIKEENGERIIIPVDYVNTGVTMKNTMWSKALHQFLQLKHNLRLTSETLTSSAISNLGYISLYGNNVFGLTGTLGSSEEMGVLSKLYNVTFCNIPTFKPKRFSELHGLVVEDHLWSITVVTTTIQKIKAKRAVLIICNSIQDVLTLENDFNVLKDEHYIDEPFQIKTYQDESFCSVTAEKLYPGDIIIATNIAGRGADFKTDFSLEKRGGLHVCVAFCPENVRVKEQAFFRTSRQGNSGTAQRIIRLSEISSYGLNKNSSIDEINILMQNLESQKMSYLLNKKVHELRFQDSLCQMYAKLNKEQTENRQIEDGLAYMLKDLKEKWAFWLDARRLEDLEFTTSAVQDLFNEFKSESCNLLNNKEIFNPFYTIQLAEYYLQNNNFNLALEAVNRVINLRKSHIYHAAFVKKFEINVEKEKALLKRLYKALSKVIVIGYIADTDASTIELKSKSISNLEKASKAFTIEISYIKENILGKQGESEPKTENSTDEGSEKSGHLKFQKCLLQPENGEKNLLFTHIYSRYICLSHYHQNVLGMIQEIKDLDGGSLAIQCRNTQFLQTLDENKKNEKAMKEAITSREISELTYLGIETTYALRGVYDVHNTTIIGAQVQIGSGLALLATGVAFPPLFIPLAQLAGTMISEGIMDIVMELISQGVAKFDTSEYVKNKAISYGISLVTMGLSTILTCGKVLNAAIKACKNLSELLRRSQRLKSLCEMLACWIDNIQKWLKRIKYMKAIQYLTHIKNAQTMPYSKVFFPALSKIITGSIKQVTTAIIMEKVVKIAINDFITMNFESKIKEKVLKNLKDNSSLCKKLEVLKINDIYDNSSEILNGPKVSLLQEISSEIFIGVARSYLGPIENLIIDTTKSYKVVNKFLNYYTDLLYEKLCCLDGKEENCVDDVINNLADSVTFRIIAELNNISSKYANMLVVASLDKAIDIASSMNEPSESQGQTKNDDGDPWKKLGLEPGASDEEIQEAYLKYILANRSKDSNTAQTDIDIAKVSMQFLMESDMKLSSPENNCVMDSSASLLDVPVEAVSGATGFASAGIGASIDNAASILKKVGLDACRDVIGPPDSGTSDRIDNFLSNNNSEKCIAFIKFENTDMGHAPIVKKENGNVFVYENDGSKMSWDDYTKNKPNIEKVTFLTGKDLSSKLPNAKKYIDTNKNKYTVFTPLGATVDSSFYGKREKKVMETFYPGGIEVGGIKHEQVLNKLKTKFNKAFNKAEEHGIPLKVIKDDKNPKQRKHEVDADAISGKQAQLIQNKKGVYIFGKDLLSKESDRMVAALEVEFTNGRKEKILTISGDTPIKSYQKVEVNNLTMTPKETQDLRFKSAIDGFIFYNVGKPVGKVRNLKTGDWTDTEYSRSCAAQKGLYVVNTMMNKDPKLRVKNIIMTEVMWSPNKKTIHNPVPSCSDCQNTIPSAMINKK